MKKVIVTLMLIVASLNVSLAQNYVERSIENIQNGEELDFCGDEYDGIIIYGRTGCQNEWTVDNLGYFVADSIVLDNTNVNLYEGVGIAHLACLQWTTFFVIFWDSYIENPFPEPIVWKRQGETVKLGNEYPGIYEYLWSNDSTNCEIEVIEPGIYSVTMNQIYGCGSETFSVEVRDNVELYRATVDLETKLNKVTWQTTPEQAEYISEVKVERDGMVVGTAPYGQGYFLDNIGSENAARNYRLTAITTDGTECPIPSYQKGTLHVDYSPNASNPNKLNMAWTPPFIEEGASISVSYFQICKYDPATNEVTVVDQLGANNTIGSYDVNLFDGGYAVVAAMFNEGKEYEELSFSNLTDFLVGIGENEGPSTGSGTLTVYPNPANGVLYVETRHATSLPVETYRIVNPIGQTVMEGQITAEKQQIDVRNLPQGVYFITVGGTTRKFVVE